MLSLLRLAVGFVERLLALPLVALRFIVFRLALNPRLGPLRYVMGCAIAYLVFAVALTYVVAPLRGIVGHAMIAEEIRYAAERWTATAIYDRSGSFVGTFDPRLDSRRDVNFTGEVIEVGDYTANPDHKSIPVREVPEYYWRCLVHHEDRNIGGLLNPAGIDLIGVLKIPASTLKRSLAARRPRLGVGGSTLPMQFARVIYKTPPSRSESPFDKLSRKFGEWWMAPVIYRELTRNGDDRALKQWAANHLWLAQRTGGQPLHGIEVTSRIVFGKEAKDLSIAEQLVLASAVNKPIILLEGSDRLNAVRLDRWRYIAEVRARKCVEELIDDPEAQRKVVFDLVRMAGGPPDPHVRPKLQVALETFAPAIAKRAEANPVLRANVLLPVGRYGLREEMKQVYGFGWRDHVRGVTTTLDVADNLVLRERVVSALDELEKTVGSSLNPGFTLSVARSGDSRLQGGGPAARRMPDVIVVAANAKGEIIRYFEVGETAAYFGSLYARDRASGLYLAEREGRMIASTGKMMAAIALANEGHDTLSSIYVDDQAPTSGLESCRRNGTLRQGRTALVSFACSLNRPIEWRAARLGQAPFETLIAKYGFSLPPAPQEGSATPASTAVVRGLVGGAPRRVHHMAGAVLAALSGQGQRPLLAPTLVDAYDHIDPQDAIRRPAGVAIVPDRLIRPGARALLRQLLEAPLCYEARGVRHGTMKSLSDWCAARRKGLALHFAKTGTSVTEDPDSTVDTWVAGGLKFANGAAYSYVVLVGTGSQRQPFARKLHASQVAVPLTRVLLEELERDAKRHRPLAAPKLEQRQLSATPRDASSGQLASAARRSSDGSHDLNSDVALRQRLFDPD